MEARAAPAASRSHTQYYVHMVIYLPPLHMCMFIYLIHCTRIVQVTCKFTEREKIKRTVDEICGCHNPVLVTLDSHDPRCNAHGHQLLEQ